MPRISIVIPSYSNSKGLAECLASIQEWTHLDDTEIIVVANGAPEETRAICNQFPVTLLWFDKPLGYTTATNIGINAATGEFLLLLNDDCIILSQVKSAWVDTLMQPFLDDPKMGITGPVMNYCHAAERHFLIFFCVLIRKAMLDEIGILDEIFSPGSGEDTDLSCRAVDSGWKIRQVPSEEPTKLVDKGCEDLPEWKRLKMHTADGFRLFHDGNATFGLIPEIYEPAMQKNHAILKERYGNKVNTPTGGCPKCGGLLLDGICVPCLKIDEGIDIFEASVTDGWFGNDESAQLARWVKALPPNSTVVEVGSWHGRSSRAIAANLSEGSRLYCVDTFIGSSGEPEMHGSAHYDRGDHCFTWWLCNLWKYIQAGQVIPIRAHSENAAHTLNHLGLKIDLLFIDADHSLEGFMTDVHKWAPLMKDSSLWCGHDYYLESEEPFAWIGVRTGVQKLFPDAEKTATSLWHSRSQPKIKRQVIDAFPFNDELDVLEIRLNELDPVVDRWVITEARKSHSGNDKPLYLTENMHRFERWKDRITVIVVDDFPDLSLQGSELHWSIERHQRDAIMRGLTDCKDDDIIIISDTDEIPNAEAVQSYSVEQGLCCLEMRLFYGYMNFEGYEPWRWTRILPYAKLKEISPCGARYVPNYGEHQVIKNGGCHFSFMGGPDEWVHKLNNSPHQEYNTPEINNAERMMANVRAGRDLLGRDIPYRFVPVDETFPKFIQDNIQKFRDNQFICEDAMHPESYSFVEMVKQEYLSYFTGKKVLEVGSLDINGSVRQFFDNCDYEGIDIAEGNGVDRVALAHQFVRPNTYDVVISSEMLEHDQFWTASLKQMYENLKPGGLFILSCAGPDRPEHGTKKTDTFSSPFTTDYYRNISKEDLLGVLPNKLFSECTIGYDRGQEDLHFWGVKQGVAEPASLRKKNWTVTAEISTKDRYFTTLPMSISAIATQTRKPDKLKIYDDGEQLDLRTIAPYDNLLKMLDELNIDWEILSTPRKGQVVNHQHCLEHADTDFIWRVDDDEIPLPDCLGRLLNTVRDYGRGGDYDQIGAVAGLVHHPGAVSPLPKFVDGSLNDLHAGVNIQWYEWHGTPREVEHLYSTFLLNVGAARKAGGYPKGLSTVGHREETLLTMAIKRAGYKLLVDPHAKTFHLRESTGGIRSFNDNSLWEKDEKVFQSYLSEWGMNGGKPTKLIVADMGIGDHLLLKGVLPEIRKRHLDKDFVMAVCFPEVFEDVPDIKLISIADAKNIVGDRYDEHSLYRWCWDKNWNKPVAEAMVAFWG